jgi:diguanylate cyclase (GGDEF)-like protein/PAS domain S-box-containing protein
LDDALRFLIKAVETMQLGVTVTGLDGRILFTNPADAEMHGYAPEELIGRNARMFAAPGPAHTMTADEARSAARWRRERTNLRRDGSTFPVHLLSDVVRDESGNPIGIVTSCEDITDRRRSEDSLRESTERLTALVATQQEIARAETDPRALVALVVRKAAELTGADGGSLEIAEGASFVQQAGWGIAEGRAGLRLPAEASLSGFTARAGEPVVCEDSETDERVDHAACRTVGVRSLVALPLSHERRVYGILKVLSRRPLAFAGREVQLLQLLTGTAAAAVRNALEFAASGALLADRTARLVASEERFSNVFHNSAAGMALLTEDGHVVKANAAYAAALGWREEELAGLPVARLLHAEDRIVHRASAERVLSRESRSVQREIRHLHRDGRVVWMLESLAVLSSLPGEPAHLIVQTQDIGERKRAEDSLRASEESYRLLFERNLAGVYRSTVDGQLLTCNEAFARMFGRTREQVLALPASALYDDPAFRAGFVRRLQESGTLSNIEVRLRHRDGGTVWVIENVSLLPGDEATGPVIEGTAIDITDRKRAEEILLHDAFHDSLTGLANRALFMDRLGYVGRRAVRQRTPFAVLFIDLDRFKLVNDSMGHIAGDQLLVAVAHRLERSVRAEDTVARLGGDEFAVLLDGTGSRPDAILAAERILAAFAEPFAIGARELFVSASIGIALSGDGVARPEDLLRDADTAMYGAKSAGKARLLVFEPLMRERAVAELELETDLRHALDRREFEVHYQPILVLATGEVSGFEALLRWRHPERGLLLPREFLRSLEETGLIVPVGLFVLEQAARQLAAWQERFPRATPLSMSVNISARQLGAPGLVERVRESIARTGIAARSLTLELTESVLVESPETTSALLSAFRALGVCISLDDFGTGYSSLSYLHWLPLDRLKIDRSFVAGMGVDHRHREILRTIVALATNLGMDVVAEGIETAEQLAHLRALPCEQGQGFLFAAASAADETTDLISRGPLRRGPA